MRARAAALGLVIAALGVVSAHAGSMSGPTHELLPTAVNAGGQDDHSSTSHNLLGGVSEPLGDPSGGSKYSSAHNTLQPGLGNLSAWPRTVRDLWVSSGTTEGSIVVRWTSPRADGSTGTAAAYSVRMAGELDPSPASSEAQFWLSLSATHYVTVPAPASMGTTEQLVIDGLVSGATYYFAVKARSDWDAWSWNSNEAFSYAARDSTAPDKAAGFSVVTGTGPGLLTAGWTVTGDNFSAGNILGGRFRLVYSKQSDFSGSSSVELSTSVAAGESVHHTLTGLDSETLYYVKVLLADEVPNWSEDSASASAMTLDSTAPDPPVVSVAAGANEGELDVSWNATGDNGAVGSITGGKFRVIYSRNSDFSSSSSVEFSTDTTAGQAVGHTLAGLERGAPYYVKVQLADEVPNWSGDSNAPSAAAKADLIAPSAVADLVASPGTHFGEILLTWTATGDNGALGGITGGKYRIDYSVDPGHSFGSGTYLVQFSTNTSPADYQSYLLTGLPPEIMYYVKVYLADEATNWSGGSNTASSEAQGPTGPSEPCDGCLVLLPTPAGGGRSSYSASHTLINTVGELGAAGPARRSSAHHLLDSSLAPLLLWPRTVVGVSASSGPSEGGIVLSWVSPAADGSVGAPGSYVVRYSSRPEDSPALSEEQFWLSPSATDFVAVPAPSAPGTTEQLLLTGLSGGASYYFAVKAASSWDGWSYLSRGATSYASLYMPGVVPSTFSSIDESSLRVSWSSGTPPSGYNRPGLPYAAQVSTAADFTGVVVTSVTYGLDAVLAGLSPDTTYYARACARIDLSSSAYRLYGASSTLALPPTRLAEDFLQVNFTSVTVQWAALPASQGYRVEASSTDFGALTPGGVVYSSSTRVVLLSTLTVSEPVEMDVCKTHYFRVASLNWNSVPNFAVFGSTANRQYGVVLSTHDLAIGLVDVRSELVISTSFIVRNSVCPATFKIKATTETAGTPWMLSVSSGTDRLTLQAGFNATLPTLDDFDDEDKLTDVPSTATATRFAIGQSAVAVGRNEERLMWLKLGMPKITSTDDPQVLRVTVIAASP